jgi:hypothetical protein
MKITIKNITIRHNKNCLCYNDNTPSIYIINTSKSLEHIEILYELISRGLNIDHKCVIIK